MKDFVQTQSTVTYCHVCKVNTRKLPCTIHFIRATTRIHVHVQYLNYTRTYTYIPGFTVSPFLYTQCVYKLKQQKTISTHYNVNLFYLCFNVDYTPEDNMLHRQAGIVTLYGVRNYYSSFLILALYITGSDTTHNGIKQNTSRECNVSSCVHLIVCISVALSATCYSRTDYILLIVASISCFD